MRLFDMAGLSKGFGVTFCGASKPLRAFRSLPVSVSESRTRDGATSSHSNSTSRLFARSRLKRKTENLPVTLSKVPDMSTYGTVSEAEPPRFEAEAEDATS